MPLDDSPAAPSDASTQIPLNNIPNTTMLALVPEFDGNALDVLNYFSKLDHIGTLSKWTDTDKVKESTRRRTNRSDAQSSSYP